MTGAGNDSRIAQALDGVAAILGSAAVGHSAYVLLGSFETPLRLAASFMAAPAAFLLTINALKRLAGEVRLPLPAFELVDAEFVEQEANDELVLTEADFLTCHASGAAEELLLDDVVASMASGAQVIRLFDPARMPTAGELHERIDRHLSGEPPRREAPDATLDLYQALAALKGSLR